MAQDQYDCRFNICPNDSLQILVKDLKFKRKFANLFTKLKLESLGIDLSIKELCTFLETARDAKKKNLKNWKFLIKYKSLSSIQENAELTAKNSLFSYKKGDKMVLLINVIEPRFFMKNAFKLNEIVTNNIKKPAITLSQSTTNSQMHLAYDNITNNLPRSRRNLLVTTNTTRCRTKSPRRRSQSNHTSSRSKIKHKNRKSLPMRKIIAPMETNENMEQLKQTIASLKSENGLLLNKLQDVERTPKMKRKKQDTEQKDNRIWMKHKIERMENNIHSKILKEYGINFKSNDEWKEVVNMSFNIVMKLTKTIHCKDEQYESVTNKWIKCKKENKELHKSQDINDAMIEKQKHMINQLKQQIMDKERMLNAQKQNGRSLEDTIKKMEKDLVQTQDVYDKQIDDMNEERVRLNVRLNNSIQEMKENKTDFDELQKDNDIMILDIKSLKFVIHETNDKSLQLIECIRSSKAFMEGLTTEKGETDDMLDVASSNGNATNHFNASNSNNYV